MEKILKGAVFKEKIVLIVSFIIPALGPSKITHARAVRKVGVAKVSTTMDRMNPFKGIFVLETPHAMGTPIPMPNIKVPRVISIVFRRAS
jgi:hypothetical protein